MSGASSLPDVFQRTMTCTTAACKEVDVRVLFTIYLVGVLVGLGYMIAIGLLQR